MPTSFVWNKPTCEPEMKSKILKMLDDLGIQYRWLEHPAVFTVADSRRHIADKRPIKNLLLQEHKEGRKVLVIMPGEEKLNTKLVANLLGCGKLRFASPDSLRESLGVKPGAVSIFGLLHPGSADVSVVIDEKLLHEEELGFHPNDNTSTIFIPGKDLERIVIATGHVYHVADLLF